MPLHLTGEEAADLPAGPSPGVVEIHVEGQIAVGEGPGRQARDSGGEGRQIEEGDIEKSDRRTVGRHELHGAPGRFPVLSRSSEE